MIETKPSRPVTRHDAAAAGALTPVSTGRYRSRVARTGCQKYSDINTVEMRDAATVFDLDALASLIGARVQVTHDAGSPSVGTVEGPVRRVKEGPYEYVEVVLNITDPATRARIDARQLVEISCGYGAEVVCESGIDPATGEHYTHRQTKITNFDHVALLPLDQRARCGAACRVHHDCSPTQESTTSVTDYNPRFPGKSKAYCDAYINAESASARQDAEALAAYEQRTRQPAATHDSVNRTDAEVYAAHEARMRKVYGNSFGGSPATRTDAVARRDAFRASEPDRARMSDADVDICIERNTRMDQQQAETARIHAMVSVPARVDSDPATVARIDAASSAAGVSSQDVRDYLRMHTPRNATPSQDDVEHAVHSMKLRSHFGKAGL